ncbi:hypothetical protein HZQ19_18305 [Elizabethkingia anophelis]|uniref:hypothetical protein n=1 Tax=Elizabethkingia anophelis TaxID=1117645 RepID=UPI000C9C0B11|nr:hypothetical protein [Elizabethkingia anophelis]MCT3760542.1 hypothetical protein [Elizabethkingia anophelis]MCT3975192.1 hypothetical protein [Elizabethkingia anophelis]MCT4003736.1 hypothetical protein [Elizabethkingia anophelis]MCT4017827.1 hypothetical protein [Elizabethkingia anophelis]MCT4021389.1 hypothetical protein [Elizabethkingia anophelis]
MKIINKLLIISLIISSFLIIGIYISLINEVGDISINKKIDNPNFRIERPVYQYYYSNAKYKGEREGIRNALNLKRSNITSIKNGWITIRFIISKNGDIGRFRFFSIDEQYNELNIDNNDVELLLNSIKKLKNWEIGIVKDIKVNSYYQITFKIQNGKISNIF